MENDWNSSLTYNQPYKPTPINAWTQLKSLVEVLLSLTVLAKSFLLLFFFFLRKIHTAKVPHFFSAKNDSVFEYNTFEILMSC